MSNTLKTKNLVSHRITSTNIDFLITSPLVRIFALETDVQKIIKRFCNEGECVHLVTPYHTLSFFFASLRDIVISGVLIGAGVFSWQMGWPMLATIIVLTVVWFVFVFFNLLKAYLDWAYDCIIVTQDKVILIDQTSIFKQEVKPIYVDNIGGISTSTQFWNLFPFGIVKMHLKEGLGGDSLVLRYVPRASEVAAVISNIVTEYQRKQMKKEDEKGSSEQSGE